MRINTNLASMAAERVLDMNKGNAAKSMMKLSSGERITTAADDAAGLSISERLRGQIRSQKQAQRNANDGISLVQVAEGGLAEVSNNLIRMRELSVQAASDTVGDRERGFIDQEIQQLKSEIDRVADHTNFNGTKLLNGENEKGELSIQVGSFNLQADQIGLSINNYNTKTDSIGIDGTHVRDIDAARTALEELDTALDKVNSYRADFGAMQNRLTSTSNGLGNDIEGLSAANSRIRDTDIAEESANLVKQNILNAASISVLSQANQLPAQALKLL
ncbi:MAG: flagellin FliC [Deltaproteobacteria bacterium]|nr:flagellin FliC [Deltaproteobacteria bacterium]